MAAPLTPRARAILAAVEREVSARLDELERDEDVIVPRRLAPVERARPELLLALELGVSGLSRAEVRDSLDVPDPEPVLDAVFGTGSPARARLRRAA